MRAVAIVLLLLKLHTSKDPEGFSFVVDWQSRIEFPDRSGNADEERLRSHACQGFDSDSSQK